jgi:hypothetical protein
MAEKKEGHIYVTFDATDAMATLNNMQENILEFAHTDIHDELIDWQVEDMHRKYPNIHSDQEYVSWFTLIWPRSRTYDQTHQRGHIRAMRRSSRRAAAARPLSTPTIPRGMGKRPILREALLNRLIERMSDLLGERLSWSRSTKTAAPPTQGTR